MLYSGSSLSPAPDRRILQRFGECKIMIKYICRSAQLMTAIIITTFTLTFVGACGKGVGVVPIPINTDAPTEKIKPSFSQFPDIPIPPGAEMNLDRTVILGAPESWVGRLTLETAQSPSKLFDFFKHRTIEFGWQEVTSVRSATSYLTYTQTDRVLSIQITGRTLRGSEAILTVAPKGPSINSLPNQTNSITTAPN